ncbi:hypothetical protein ZIOFF_029479 [Zingiber officinale]|uniref:Cysteine-rich receptor-like protein kinase 25 n=1 Tax=Zingiber officinale TaxID=94328 RepID=A0A8J5GWR3_ZINOF|nr:hypothetical protein ZIOFF_029479 [Zingiber officinale]
MYIRLKQINCTKSFKMRSSRKLSFLLGLIRFLLLLRAPTAAMAANPFRADCGGDAYNSSSSFGRSLSNLLSSLTFLSSASYSANATAGAGSDSVYGLYMCQGDLSGSNCQSCIQTAVAGANQSCPGVRRSIVYYDQCHLRYSDANFFGVVDADGFNMTNPLEVTSSRMAFNVLSDLVQAAPLRRPLMFATNVSDMYPLFALAQCTADLSPDGCRRCLTASLVAIENCCIQRKGWRYLSPSCWIRYEPTPFFGNYPNNLSTYIIRSQCSSLDVQSDDLSARTANLRGLFDDLSTQAPATGFYSASAGDGGDRMYGLGLCAGDDATRGECAACLATAGRAIANECPNKTEGYMWYGPCFLKYSQQRFFGELDTDVHTFCGGAAPVTAEFSRATEAGARSIAQAAWGIPSMYAAGEVVVNATARSYVLAQCTRDLTADRCQICLGGGIGRMTASCGAQSGGWQYLSGSCTVRYEQFRFFNDPSAWIAPGNSPPSSTFDLLLLRLQSNVHFTGGGRRSSKARIIAIVLPIAGASLLGIPLLSAWNLRRRKARRSIPQPIDLESLEGRDLIFMGLAAIQAATDNFSIENKLGEGGFGAVYKGVLIDGKEIAVKRLSQRSKQSLSEFENEVKLVAKLRHKNLVRLLGCCFSFLSIDPNKRSQLSWEMRFIVISGVAKGLLYLHEDSLLKIIHRDLKASNVLLDKDMNPKISDFGLAKVYTTEESDMSAPRIVGTYGYMAPEYAMDGCFFVKSDVFSYGVLLLEIISGERNGRGYAEQYGQNLLGRAWELWNDDKATELVDSMLDNNECQANEAMKCIHIGLLCVQENIEQRPTISEVVLMLQSDHIVLVRPTKPPNFARGYRVS